jgi:tyrosyl-tRNA synthetase
LTMPILEGLDGVKKMSKSLGNYIGVDEEPNNMYGKTMSIPDELMLKYFELVTDLTLDELENLKQELEQGKMHPRDAKMRLAHTLVRMYHGKEAADEAQKHFQTVFQKGSLPDEIPEVALAEEDLEEGKIWVVALLSKLGLVASNGEGRRMIQQGGVRINQEKVTDIQAQIQVEDGMVVQVGKRKFAKVKRN